jgi:TetR/AcrR family transcriptional regulator, cholesterol catabolism regulator
MLDRDDRLPLETDSADSGRRGPGKGVDADDRAPGANGTADLILREAAAMFRERGYVRATTRELGNAVGIRGPSVYYHYKTKEEILYGICVESLSKLTAQVAPAQEIDDALERVRALIEMHVVNILEDRDMHATMLTEMRFLSPELRERVTLRRDEYESGVSETLAEAQRQGKIRADIPARQLSLALLSLLNWTIFWFRPDGPLSVVDVSRLLSTVFLDGATPRTAPAADAES